MSDSATPRVNLPLTVTAMLATQMTTVLLFITIPVMATEVAPVFGAPAKDIAVFVSVSFVSSMFFSAASGSLINRFGGIRANQIGMTISALCLLLTLSGSLPLLYLAAILVGMGYGPNTPSGSHVLARVTPARSRALVFSLKQSGAPLGGLIAGLLVPAMVHTVGWRGAILVSAGIALCAVVAIQPLRGELDNDRDPAARLSFSSPWKAVASVMGDPDLRRLLLVAFSLTAAQATVMTFLVIYLIEVLEFEFILAGALFSAAQAAGAAFRVGMGWLADRMFGARVAMVVLGLASALGLVLFTTLSTNSPLFLIAAVVIGLGAVSFGWNGVFLAEVAARPGTAGVGAATGGSLFFIYGGLVLGPLAASGLVSLTSSYTVPFLGVACLAGLTSLNLLRSLRGPPARL